MTEIAKAYVQIIPSMEGFNTAIKKNVEGEAGEAGEKSGGIFSKMFAAGSQGGLKGFAGAAGSAMLDFGKQAVTGIAKVSGAAIAAGASAAVALGKQALDAYSEFEQLSGGAQKIFDQMDYSKIAADAQNAYKTMNISASEYLEMMNSVGATFSQTMGDEKGYNTAKIGMQAIADYASGTGKDVGMLNDKFALITRSAASYQSIADQFSGILPALSSDFLAQAQAAGYLSGNYKSLTEVPVAEYQEAVSLMLQKGVQDLGLMNNTVRESETTLAGSTAAMKAAWQNLLVGIADDQADLDALINNFVDSVITAGDNLIPRVETILGGLGQLISAAAEKLVPTVVNYIVSNLPQIVATGTQLIITLAGALIQALPQLVASIPQIINAIISGIRAQWPNIQNAGRDIVNQLGNAIKGLASSAGSWGRDMMDSFIGGIKAKFAALREAAASAAQTVKNFLGFSEPKEGPLSNFHTYAPDMMKLFAEGIYQNLGVVEKAIDGLEGIAASEINGYSMSASGYNAAALRNTVPAENSMQLRTDVRCRFEGSLAQLAMVLQPVVTAETRRVGKELAPA